MPLTEFEKGYIAGLLDGEGSITIYKNQERRSQSKRFRSKLGFTLGVNVRIHNTDLNLLNRINEIFPGHINLSTKINKKLVYCWRLSDKKKIVELLEQLVEHLIVKKEKAIKAIEFCYSRIHRQSFKAGYTDKEISIAENWRN